MRLTSNKDKFIELHEQMIEEYLEEYPEASESEAYDATADLAYEQFNSGYY